MELVDNKLQLRMAFLVNNSVASRNPSVMVFVSANVLIISTAYYALALLANGPVAMLQAMPVSQPILKIDFKKQQINITVEWRGKETDKNVSMFPIVRVTALLQQWTFQYCLFSSNAFMIVS